MYFLGSGNLCQGTFHIDALLHPFRLWLPVLSWALPGILFTLLVMISYAGFPSIDTHFTLFKLWLSLNLFRFSSGYPSIWMPTSLCSGLNIHSGFRHPNHLCVEPPSSLRWAEGCLYTWILSQLAQTLTTHAKPPLPDALLKPVHFHFGFPWLGTDTSLALLYNHFRTKLFQKRNK